MRVTLVGFDSAWSDNPKAPGAICALRLGDSRPSAFTPPRLVGFDDARSFIEQRADDSHVTLVAIDQPTIVPNKRGMRSAERAVASVMSWSGGAIQPGFRDKTSMFGDGAPIWRFIESLGYGLDPEAARVATVGGFVMEVYPALALLSLDPTFAAGPKQGPRYNPARKTFQQTAWSTVCVAAEREATRLALPEAAAWCAALDRKTKPRKGVQDCLDALLCLLIAARWIRERERCVMIGDLDTGYIVAPVDTVVKARLETSAAKVGVRVTFERSLL